MKFGTDGVRGVAHEELTTEFAVRLARAASRVLGADGCSTVVIGGDTRESTAAFDEALSEGFASSGIDVVRMGVASTPAVAFEAQRRGAMGAVVSASHNPWHDNGIKLFAPGGTKLPDDVESRIEAAIDHDSGASGAVGTVSLDRSFDAYGDHALSILDGRDLSGLTVVLDVANGAAVDIAPDVLRSTGAEVIVICLLYTSPSPRD